MSEIEHSSEAAREAYERAEAEIDSATIKPAPTLRLSGTQFKALEKIPKKISKHPSLFALEISNTSLTDLSPLSDVLLLDELLIAETKVTSLAPLEQVISLSQLKANGTQIASLEPLRNLINLTSLDVEDCPIEDIKPLQNLPNLSFLSLSGTQVSDLTPLTNMPGFGGNRSSFLYFEGTPACEMDRELARLSKVRNSKKRTRETLAYLRSLNGVWPPKPPEADQPDPQSPFGARYLTKDGQIAYDPAPPTDDLPSVVQQIHASLITDTDALLAACSTTHNRYGALGTALTAYRTQLSDAPGEIVAFTFWKAGNDLRKRLKADAAQEEDALEGMHKLDPERAALLEGLVETHNVLVSNMPALEAIDIATIDPAERARMEANRTLISDMIGALEDQVRLFIEQIRTDLVDLNAEAYGAGAKAERAAVLTDESLHNLIREAVAQAVLQLKDPPKSMVATFASQTPGAAMGVVAPGTTAAAAAYFPELVVMLEPYLAQLATHWQATSPNMRKTVDWIAARVKHGDWRS